MAKRIIAVAGATGNQGGSVVRALANHPQFEVRALTRNPDSDSSKKLLKLGSNIKLQKADILSKSSLLEALQGAYGFFAFTNYFAHKIQKESDIKEEEEGRMMGDAAKEAGIQHLIFSTLPEVKERSKGQFKNVHHFDGKHRVEQYMRSLGFPIDSYVAPSAYTSNFTGGGGNPRLDEEGTVVFTLPMPSLDATFPICDIEHDLGVVVKAVFEQGEKAKGKLYPIISEFLRVGDIAPVFEKVTGRKSKVALIPKEQYVGMLSQFMGEFVAIDLWEMFNCYPVIGFGEASEPQNLKNTESLGVKLYNWEESLKDSGYKGPQ